MSLGIPGSTGDEVPVKTSRWSVNATACASNAVIEGAGGIAPEMVQMLQHLPHSWLFDAGLPLSSAV